LLLFFNCGVYIYGSSNFIAMDEQLIITKCQAGSLEEFAKLYDKYLDKIYQFVFYRTSHRETAEDLTAQIFMKALERIGSYDSQQAQFATWLYRVARNTIIDYYRSQKKDANIDDYWDLRAHGPRLSLVQ